MAENTLQFRWIVTIQGGLDAQYRDDLNVFVAGDLLWYPVEGMPTIRQAPDIFTAFNRPKGYRGSYKQWEEDGIAPHVVFEILSPGNTVPEMTRKFQFYEQYGVEEYYVYDPDTNDLTGWIREGDALRELAEMNGWVSPRLQIRFELTSDDLIIYGRDGRRFLTYVELAAQRDKELAAREQAERQSEQAQRQAEQAQNQAQEEAKKVEKLAAQLRALGIEPQL